MYYFFKINTLFYNWLLLADLIQTILLMTQCVPQKWFGSAVCVERNR